MAESQKAESQKAEPQRAESQMAEIQLRVNGEPRSCGAGLSLDQALERLGYRPQLVVVEFNGSILPRSRWSEQPVVESDVLEVVTIVGGGS
jgi:sulfur carrier protein